jgi:hypothetical protein
MEDQDNNDNLLELELDDFELAPISSAEMLAGESDDILPDFASPEIAPVNEISVEPATDTDDRLLNDPVFAELAMPKLPNLERENRARLHMQTPNRIYFYWSIKNNPFRVLNKVFAGNVGNYQLVVKFVNLKTGREEIRPVEAEGNFWYNVEADSTYRAEIGFYAPNRPYIRVIFSNTISTPRKSPSPRAASDADWAISSAAFADVLDHSGFQADAYEVALAGDDAFVAATATKRAFADLIGPAASDFSALDSDELRFALVALASGVSLDELRGQISEALFLILGEHAAASDADAALQSLKRHFDIFEEIVEEVEELGAAVYGASLVHFPRTRRMKTRPKSIDGKDYPENAPRILPKLSPLSSATWKSN